MKPTIDPSTIRPVPPSEMRQRYGLTTTMPDTSGFISSARAFDKLAATLREFSRRWEEILTHAAAWHRQHIGPLPGSLRTSRLRKKRRSLVLHRYLAAHPSDH